MILRLYRRRLGLAEHAAQLEYMIKFQDIKSQPSEDRGFKSDELQTRLRPYVYYQCLPKVRKRVLARLPDIHPGVRFYDVVCSRRSEAFSDFSRLEGQLDLAEPFRDETWLRTWLTSLGEDAVRFEVLPSGSLAMVFNNESATAVWKGLRDVICVVATEIYDIGQLQAYPQTQPNAEQVVGELRRSLENLGNHMQTLRLACGSNSVHRVLQGKDIRSFEVSLEPPSRTTS